MRYIVLIFVICSFAIKALWISLASKGTERSKLLSQNAHNHAKKVIKFFNVSLKMGGEFPKGSFLAAANHLSYIDVIMLAALYPSTYISYTRIERIFFVGGMARLGGTLFLERENKHKMHQDIEKIAAMLASGNSVTIFPEGRCTNGDTVIDFHGAYIQAAVAAGIPVVPICITYKSVNGETICLSNRDFLFIYGKTPFGPHIIRLIRRLRSVEIEVQVFPPIDAAAGDRKAIALAAHTDVLGYYTANSPLLAKL
ncbi:MAG: 1-acyl-sn-glycerol-3-phosphate acyltransferase [Deferribacteraceae bacterium]|jgi:1-acyl-sn-glycerol-3-phosphate acyltransferase|nr:1-acyl-sn-glycerol-3-phosphate acyltransferase [Deferribacteraceae bacterium]